MHKTHDQIPSEELYPISSLELYRKFIEAMSGINANKVNTISIEKQESIRQSILKSTKKFFTPRSVSTAGDPTKAFSQIDIQRLLNGKKDAVTPGYGTIDLFNNPKLKKKEKKLTSKDILGILLT